GGSPPWGRGGPGQKGAPAAGRAANTIQPSSPWRGGYRREREPTDRGGVRWALRRRGPSPVPRTRTTTSSGSQRHASATRFASRLTSRTQSARATASWRTSSGERSQRVARAQSRVSSSWRPAYPPGGGARQAPLPSLNMRLSPSRRRIGGGRDQPRRRRPANTG